MLTESQELLMELRILKVEKGAWADENSTDTAICRDFKNPIDPNSRKWIDMFHSSFHGFIHCTEKRNQKLLRLKFESFLLKHANTHM